MNSMWQKLCKKLLCIVVCTSLAALICLKVLMETRNPMTLSITNFKIDEDTNEINSNIDFRRGLASQLAEISNSLKNHKGVDPHVLLQLNQVIGQLDPRHAASVSNLLTPDDQEPDTCGEEYNGTRFGLPFYREGFVRSPSCNKTTALNKLITVMFYDTGQPEVIQKLLKGVQNTHQNLPIIVASPNKPPVGATDKEQRVHWFVTKQKGKTKKELTLGAVLNAVMKNITTPYVLLGTNMYYFDSLSRLERQIHVISSFSSMGIAGGAFRNQSGHWKVGCHLSEIRNYFLKYTEGYKYSAKDCMFCDYLEGPFVARTSIVKKIKFREDLSSKVLFQDWFLRVRKAGVLIMNCPDVMYFTQGPVEDLDNGSQKEWQALAKVWEIVRVKTPSGAQFSFTCPDLGLSCRTHKWFKAYLIPTCCLVEVSTALRALDKFAQEHDTDYEIEAGTILGAVKLRSFLPWDKDGDITFLTKDYGTFFNSTEHFSNQRLMLDMFKPNKYFRLNTPSIVLEMWGSDTLSTFNLPEGMQKIPTKIKMVGEWVRGVWNPGLFSRNRYGPDYLKHVQHWDTLGFSSSWKTYTPGSWLKCPKKDKHMCLDHYPTDGSVGFVPGI